MFTAIQTYLKALNLDAVHLSISLEGELLRVVTSPFVADETRAASLTPLLVTVSASDLEAGYGQALNTFQTGQLSLGLEQQVQASLEQAIAAKDAKPTPSKKPANSTPTPPKAPVTPPNAPEPQGLFSATPAVEAPATLEPELAAEPIPSALPVQPEPVAQAANTVPFVAANPPAPVRTPAVIQAEINALKPKINTFARDFFDKDGILSDGVLHPALEGSKLGKEYLNLGLELFALEKLEKGAA